MVPLGVQQPQEKEQQRQSLPQKTSLHKPQLSSQQPPMAPIGSLPSGPQPMSGPGSSRLDGGRPPQNGFVVPSMHQMGMGPGLMTPMHAVTPPSNHGGHEARTTEPSMGVIGPQQTTTTQVIYQGQYRPSLVDPHEDMPLPLDPQSDRLPVPTQPQPPDSGLDSGRIVYKPPPSVGKKKRKHNVPSNSAASERAIGVPLVKRPRKAAKASTQSPASAPPSAQRPKWMGDLSFDMTDVFGSIGWTPLEQVLEHPNSPDFIDTGFTYDSLAGLDYLQYPHTEAFGTPSIHHLLVRDSPPFAAPMAEYTYGSSYTTSSPGRPYTPPH